MDRLGGVREECVSECARRGDRGPACGEREAEGAEAGVAGARGAIFEGTASGMVSYNYKVCFTNINFLL